MLTEDEIRDALHASRVVPLQTTSPHGPLGLEQLAEEVTAVRGDITARRPRHEEKKPADQTGSEP
jgi:hypothetical protein